MATILHSEISEPYPCPYLADRDHQMENRLMIDVTAEEADALLIRGWRRFGPHYFRPVCSHCQECLSVRIPVAEFSPSKSQRRAFRKCQDLKVLLRVPQVDQERLDLYAAWHENREQIKGWPNNPLDANAYFHQFCFPHPCARELAYYYEDKLVGVGIVDEMPHSVSSVYFFSAPEFAHLSIGVASVLFEIKLARMRGLSYLYLGYNVLRCESLRYKSAYRPQEILIGRPELDATPVWAKLDLAAMSGVEN